ncbi:MAG: helix-turn-helix domain-containing protein [Acutalibacteraceae bacterium]
MLNENLVKVRRERGLTQEALAVKLNVVRQTISKWEKGTAVPDADTLCRIADALDVSVSVLLGGSEHEDKLDTASIAKSLAQINEQLAIRNRRTANVWKIVCLCSLIVICILIGKICFGSSISENTSNVMLPDKIEASNVRFYGNDKDTICSFVPSVGNDDIIYTVTLVCTNNSFPNATTVAQYEGGICTAAFDKDQLSEYAEYSAVLNIDYKGDIRNLTLAEVLNFEENSYSWQSEWN